MKIPVIARKYLPIKPSFGIRDGLIFWLALDHFNAPGWLYGVTGCAWALLLIMTWLVFVTQTGVHPSQVPK